MHLNLLEKKLNSNLLYSYVILIILWMSTIYYLIDKKFHTHAHEHICIYIHTYILWRQFLPRPSVALVVIFGFGESHIGRKAFFFMSYKG